MGRTSCARRRAGSSSIRTGSPPCGAAASATTTRRAPITCRWSAARSATGRRRGSSASRPCRTVQRTGSARYNGRVLITISGLPGSGKTTVARLVAKELGLEHVYAGDIFRRQAAAAGVSLEEYTRRAERDHSIDRALDDQMRRRAAAGNAVLEGRLAAFMAEEVGQ